MHVGKRGLGVVRCIHVREFARCYVQVAPHASQVCACLQPGGSLQVCLLPPVPSGPREPLSRVLESPSCRENQGILVPDLRPSEVGVDVGKQLAGESRRFVKCASAGACWQWSRLRTWRPEPGDWEQRP